MTPIRSLKYLVGATTLAMVAPASWSQDRTQTYLDLQAGLGYSSNPLLVVGSSPGSTFGRISAYGYHGWSSERSSSSVSAYVENDIYFRRFSDKQLFNLSGATARSVSENVRLFANVGFSGDFGGQLSSRFYGVPAGAVAVDPTLPTNFVTVLDPDLYALNQRTYRLSGQLGANVKLSPRDTLTATAGGQRAFFSRNGSDLNYTTYDGSIGYQRQVSEYIGVGVRAIATRTDYSGGRALTSFGPQATLSARIGPNLSADVALGFVRTERDLAIGGKSSTTDLAVDASLCRSLEYSRFCGRIARRTQSSVLGASPTTSSIGADYYQKLSAKDQFQVSAAVVQTAGLREIGLPKQTFYTLSGNYDRQISDRFSAGVNLAARKLAITGDDPKADLSASAFVRYRLGNVR